MADKKKTILMIYIKNLYIKKRNKAGRNSTGHITCRHRGGLLTKRFLLINFRRRIFNSIGYVIHLKKERVRSAFVALIFYGEFGIYEYILAAHKLQKGSLICCFDVNLRKTLEFSKYTKYSQVIFNLGNSYMLKTLKIGSNVFNLEKYPGQGGHFLRAAGTVGRLVQKITISFLKKIYVVVRLKSGKIFYLKGECHGVLGQASNTKHVEKKLGKSGTSRRLGCRPHVRGVAMNPVDHPHGGGEGKTSGGRSSVSPWGRLTKGKRTLALYKRVKSKKLIRKFIFGKGKV